MTQLYERQDAAEMPETYTDIQLKIFRDRYAFNGEQFPHEAWRRVAGAVAAHDAESAGYWGDRFYDLLSGFKYVPGGRIMAAMGSGAEVTAQNCYVLPSPEDSRDGIMDSLRQWVEIQSKGGGVGINMSSLRPRGDMVKGVNGTSSGPVNWAQPFAFISKSVIIQGGSRRGAAMIMLDVDHPDVFEFIHAKETPGVLEGCNVSVCLSDAYMDAVKRDADWDLAFNGKVYRTVKARQIWDEICEAAWRSAEPGIYFMDRANKESNSSYFETLISTNPCGEQPLGPYGACLLGSFNLDSFMREDLDGGWRFDYEEFKAYIPYAVRFNDNVVDLSHYPLEQCRDSQQRIRRMGIGVMGLADCLLKQKIRYGSPESIAFTESVFQTLRDGAYSASIELAKERGAFPEFTIEYLRRPFIRRLPHEIQQGIADHGIRNCYLLTQAPTGTTSLLGGVNSGIEPYFDFDYLRSDRTGNYSMTSQWADMYTSGDRPEWLVGSSDVTPEGHVLVQAAAQRFNDSSISKTANAPASHTVEDVKRLYMLAYDEDLKSISYYRDGSRSEQVLYHKESPADAKSAVAAAEELLARHGGPIRRRLPDERQAITHKFRVGEQEGYMTVGLFEDGTPGEVFINVNKQGSTVSGLMDTVAMLTSYSLQYGVPLSELASKLRNTRFEPSGPTSNKQIPIATSIVDYVFRWLELKFDTAYSGAQPALIPADEIAVSTNAQVNASKHSDSVASGVGCPECGAVLYYAEGCLICHNCFYNKCG
ncbi:MAG TPA: adenosylcobalamin-dependent ribonucleoside-diphosphate reductase [Tepidiformaceae bacterium]|nr:adenosylcobalamin-dependent ribonucleoside-diphosphate reductase [Tepidiformaceae bacterium]